MKRAIIIACAGLILLFGCSKSSDPQSAEQGGGPGNTVREPVPFNKLPASTKTFDLAGTITHVNVMGTQRSALPGFPNMEVKANMLRGFVKDVFGRPLKGAEIGVRSSLVGGAYSSAVGQSDEKGYYEVPLPAGTADIFKASYTIGYQGGRAPVSLFPADSNLTHFLSTNGSVKHFVLLPYGQRHPDAVSEAPWWSSNYLGGTIHIGYNIRTQSLPLPGSIPPPEPSLLRSSHLKTCSMPMKGSPSL